MSWILCSSGDAGEAKMVRYISDTDLLALKKSNKIIWTSSMPGALWSNKSQLFRGYMLAADSDK
jgi:hypothetical protein